MTMDTITMRTITAVAPIAGTTMATWCSARAA